MRKRIVSLALASSLLSAPSVASAWGPEPEAGFDLELGFRRLGMDDGLLHADRNLTFGHEGGTFRLVPTWVDRRGEETPFFELTARADGRDDLVDVGIPLMGRLAWNRPLGWRWLDLDLVAGFDQLGAAWGDQIGPDGSAFSVGVGSMARARIYISSLEIQWLGGHRAQAMFVNPERDTGAPEQIGEPEPQPIYERDWSYAALAVSAPISDSLRLGVEHGTQYWRMVGPRDFAAPNSLVQYAQVFANLELGRDWLASTNLGTRWTLEPEGGPAERAGAFAGFSITWTPRFGDTQQVSPREPCECEAPAPQSAPRAREPLPTIRGTERAADTSR